MPNRWGIPKDIEKAVIERDTQCIYCGSSFTTERRFKASWEHIINDINIVTIGNIALCCVGCNASKGAKTLGDWLKSPEATKRGISLKTLSPIIHKALKAHKGKPKK